MKIKKASDFFRPGIVDVLNRSEDKAKVEQVIAAIDLGARQAEEWAKRAPNKAEALAIQHNTQAGYLIQDLILARILDRCFECGFVYHYGESDCPLCGAEQ